MRHYLFPCLLRCWCADLLLLFFSANLLNSRAAMLLFSFCWAAATFLFLLSSKAPELLNCWAVELLSCWADTDLILILSWWAPELLRCWAAKLLCFWAAELLSCSAAELLGCWAAELIGYEQLYWVADLLICWFAELLIRVVLSGSQATRRPFLMQFHQ